MKLENSKIRDGITRYHGQAGSIFDCTGIFVCFGAWQWL